MKQMKKTIYTLIGIAIMLLGFFATCNVRQNDQTGMRVLFIFTGDKFTSRKPSASHTAYSRTPLSRRQQQDEHKHRH